MINSSADRYDKYLKITRKYEKCLENIWDDTAASSNLNTTLKHPDFNYLLNEGKKIVPWLVYHGTHKGFDWTHLLLLGKITGERPWPEECAGRFTAQIGYWLVWYENNFVKPNCVYYGLVE